MNYQVQLNNGQTIDLKGVTGFDANEFTQTLNDRAVQFVNIGGAVINKNIIICIVPVQITENDTETQV